MCAMFTQTSNLSRIIDSDSESDSGEETTVIYQQSSQFASQSFTPTNIRDNSSGKLNAISRAPIRRTQSAHIIPFIVVLDLDGTLISSSTSPNSSYDFTVNIPDENGELNTIYVTKRPHLDNFLSKIIQFTKPYLFSSAQPEYVNQIVSYIDPLGQIFTKILYNDSCKIVNSNICFKDITLITTNLQRAVLVDDQYESFGDRLENGVKVPGFDGDPHDRELDTLATILERLKTFDDVRTILRKINQK